MPKPAHPRKNTTADDSLALYAELTPAQVRAIQRRLKAGHLRRITAGIVSAAAPEEWPDLIARNRNRVLAAKFPGAVIGFRSAFNGGMPEAGLIHLTYTYDRAVALPGLQVILVKGPPNAAGDQPIGALNFYFPSQARTLLENLTISRGSVPKAAGRKEVEGRLLTIYQARGEEALSRVRDEARALSTVLGLKREFAILDDLIGAILGTRVAVMSTPQGRAIAAPLPYDSTRLELFEKLAAVMRKTPLEQPAAVSRSQQARTNFAFLEAYFSNFIEGTEFEVAEARAFVLEGKPNVGRPKDSHDVIGVFRQALNPGWANQTLASGEPILAQLRARHADQMNERPEVQPGEFKDRENYAGGTSFVLPRFVRGTLVQGSRILPSVPEGTARALFAMFLIAEVHPFLDGNGRLARLVMNAELSAMNSCRIIIPTLFREEALDCLRVLTRDQESAPFIAAMQKIHRWTAAFDYEDLDKTIAAMTACNAFQKSRTHYKLLMP